MYGKGKWQMMYFVGINFVFDNLMVERATQSLIQKMARENGRYYSSCKDANVC